MTGTQSTTDAVDDLVLVPDPNESLVLHLRRSDGTSVSDDEADALNASMASRMDRTLRAPARLDVRRGYVLLAEGDSWVNIKWPLSAPLGYDQTFVDAIGMTTDIQIVNIGRPSDVISSIANSIGYEQQLLSGRYDFFVLTGGGNDFLGGGALTDYLLPEGTSKTAAGCIDAEKFKRIMERVSGSYSKMLTKIDAWRANGRVDINMHVLLQGYDHAVPRIGGIWLGRPFEASRYDPTGKLALDIVRHVVDEFYETLSLVASKHEKVHVVNVRGCCAGDWNDELHPKTAASRRIARKFVDKMDALRSSS